MDNDNEICYCESCESLRKNHCLDPYFPNDEHDMMQESNLFPWLDDPSFDGDILDQL